MAHRFDIDFGSKEDQKLFNKVLSDVQRILGKHGVNNETLLSCNKTLQAAEAIASVIKYNKGADEYWANLEREEA